MSLVHRTCFDVYERRPFFSTAIQSNWIAIKPIERIIIPAFELIYMYFISRIWKNKSVNFRMCMSQKKMEKKIRIFDVNQENIWNWWWLSFPNYASMSEWTTYQVYRGLFMHSCFLFYEFTLYPVSDSASTKNFASQQHIPSDVDGYKFKTTCRLNVL